MDKEKRENKENMGDWKIVNFDFASLYPQMRTFYIDMKSQSRKSKIRKIWSETKI